MSDVMSAIMADVMSAVMSAIISDVMSDVTGRFKKNAIVSNDDIWFSLYLGLRASDLQNSCVYPP